MTQPPNQSTPGRFIVERLLAGVRSDRLQRLCGKVRYAIMTTNTVYCGIDHGTKRIGLALSNPEGTIASPLSAVDAKGPQERVIQRVVQAVADFDVDEWVVGLPLNMNGTEGEQAELARRFGEQLARITNKPVHFWDERLSSHSADELLSQADLTRKKKKTRRDAAAAQVILQSFLDSRQRS